jgi:hypothetical protein
MYDGGVSARLYINYPNIQYEAPIFIALRPLNMLTPEALLNAIEKVLNSNRGIEIDQQLQIHIGIMDIHRGGGVAKKLTRMYSADPFCCKMKKKSISSISRHARHPTCAARAIMCGVTRLRCSVTKYKRVAAKNRSRQFLIAIDMLKHVGLPATREIAIDEYVHIENYLKCQIIVYDAPFKNSCIYGGAYERDDKIFLYHSEGHFDLITSMSGFLSSRYFCVKCKVPYSKPKSHSCNIYCKTCEHFNCEIETPMSCRICSRTCRSYACFDRHAAKTGERGELQSV